MQTNTKFIENINDEIASFILIGLSYWFRKETKKKGFQIKQYSISLIFLSGVPSKLNISTLGSFTYGW